MKRFRSGRPGPRLPGHGHVGRVGHSGHGGHGGPAVRIGASVTASMAGTAGRHKQAGTLSRSCRAGPKLVHHCITVSGGCPQLRRGLSHESESPARLNASCRFVLFRDGSIRVVFGQTDNLMQLTKPAVDSNVLLMKCADVRIRNMLFRMRTIFCNPATHQNVFFNRFPLHFANR